MAEGFMKVFTFDVSLEPFLQRSNTFPLNRIEIRNLRDKFSDPNKLITKSALAMKMKMNRKREGLTDDDYSEIFMNVESTSGANVLPTVSRDNISTRLTGSLTDPYGIQHVMPPYPSTDISHRVAAQQPRLFGTIPAPTIPDRSQNMQAHDNSNIDVSSFVKREFPGMRQDQPVADDLGYQDTSGQGAPTAQRVMLDTAMLEDPQEHGATPFYGKDDNNRLVAQEGFSLMVASVSVLTFSTLAIVDQIHKCTRT